MKVRLRIVDDQLVRHDREKYYVCVAKDRLEPDWDSHAPQLRPAQLEQWDEFKGAWLPVEIKP